MDLSSLLLGIVIGIVGALGTAFLKKAGEDLYMWLKKKINPKLVADSTPQVVVHLHNNRENHQPEVAQPGLAPAVIERLNIVSFDDIEKAIDNAPPMQREHVANRFVGLMIEWDSYLRNAHMQKNGNVYLRLSIDKEYRGRAITCEVPTDKYRELGILPQGSHIRVVGEITGASSFEVKLSNVRLQIFPNTATA